jgi:hypothetical protein
MWSVFAPYAAGQQFTYSTGKGNYKKKAFIYIYMKDLT